MFIGAVFKSDTKWSNAHVNVSTNTKLPTTADTFHSFGLVIYVLQYVLQTSRYQNAAKFLTPPNSKKDLQSFFVPKEK